MQLKDKRQRKSGRNKMKVKNKTHMRLQDKHQNKPKIKMEKNVG